MDETAPSASMPALPAPPKAPPKQLRAIVSVVALVLVAVIAYVLWQSRIHVPVAPDLGGDVRQLRSDADSHARGIDQSHRDIETLRSRLDDADKVNASLREQLLGLSERARLAEDAVANLADKRLSGHDAMLLDETEMLLAKYGPKARPLASLGYKQAAQFLRGELSRGSALLAAQQAHRNYAKRQLTWFQIGRAHV